MKKSEKEAQIKEFKDEENILDFQHEYLRLLKKIEKNTRKV